MIKRKINCGVGINEAGLSEFEENNTIYNACPGQHKAATAITKKERSRRQKPSRVGMHRAPRNYITTGQGEYYTEVPQQGTVKKYADDKKAFILAQ